MKKSIAALILLLLGSAQGRACELQEARVAKGVGGLSGERVVEVCLPGDKGLEFKLPRGTDWYELFKPNENDHEFRKQVEAATGMDFDGYLENLAGVDDRVALHGTNDSALKYLANKYTYANSGIAPPLPAPDVQAPASTGGH